ncbi:MAG: YcfL family protein [Verrucomicrobiota bacterium]
MKTNLLLFSLVLVLLSGCDTVNTVERQDPIMRPDYVAVNKVITDSDLDDIVSVENVVQSTVSGDLLKIQVELRNKTSSYHRFVYRFQWFDSDGMQVIRVAPPWRPGQIEGREIVYISGVAPSPQAKDFRVQLLASDPGELSGPSGTSTNPKARTLAK